jgi:hypothetical protein
LAEIIEPNEINARTKRTEDEAGMTEEELWERTINNLREE